MNFEGMNFNRWHALSALGILLIIVSLVLWPKQQVPEPPDRSSFEGHPKRAVITHYHNNRPGFVYEVEEYIDRKTWSLTILRIKEKRWVIIKDGQAMAMQPLPDWEPEEKKNEAHD